MTTAPMPASLDGVSSVVRPAIVPRRARAVRTTRALVVRTTPTAKVSTPLHPYVTRAPVSALRANVGETRRNAGGPILPTATRQGCVGHAWRMRTVRRVNPSAHRTTDAVVARPAPNAKGARLQLPSATRATASASNAFLASKRRRVGRRASRSARRAASVNSAQPTQTAMPRRPFARPGTNALPAWTTKTATPASAGPLFAMQVIRELACNAWPMATAARLTPRDAM